MSVIVRIPTTLRPITGGQAEVKVEGTSLVEVLTSLDAAHPGFKDRIFDDQGQLRRFVNVFRRRRRRALPPGPRHPVPDGETVSIIPAVAGG